jgi:hypothetical protein
MFLPEDLDAARSCFPMRDGLLTCEGTVVAVWAEATNIGREEYAAGNTA